MSSKYVQPKILAFFVLIKMNDYDKYQEKIKIKKKKKSFLSWVKSRSSIIISLKLYSLSKMSGVILKQNYKNVHKAPFCHIYFYTK